MRKADNDFSGKIVSEFDGHEVVILLIILTW